jgi:hypothetical protein
MPTLMLLLAPAAAAFWGLQKYSTSLFFMPAGSPVSVKLLLLMFVYPWACRVVAAELLLLLLLLLPLTMPRTDAAIFSKPPLSPT